MGHHIEYVNVLSVMFPCIFNCQCWHVILIGSICSRNVVHDFTLDHCQLSKRAISPHRRLVVMRELPQNAY